MIARSTAPILVIGLGCRRGCSAGQLWQLIQPALDHAAIALPTISALASLEHKCLEPGLMQLAQQLNLPVHGFSTEQLQGYAPALSHRSMAAFAATGCYGVAESAALALAEQLGKAPARLLIVRQKSAVATFALAVSG